MDFDLERRTASFGVGEFSDFRPGPREASGGAGGLWRAQLGSHWHRHLQAQVETEAPQARFEVPIEGRLFHRGWNLALTGRIDQVLPKKGGTVLREVKTVTRALPAPEAELRSDYPAYFVQLATYLVLRTRVPAASESKVPRETESGITRAELCFVEADTGLVQVVPLTPADDALFTVQLERVVDFLDARLRSRERLRRLTFRPAFAVLRPGQENTRAELATALASTPAPLFFEAPTGFGKTGVMLECALDLLQSGSVERLVYLTSKSTGQLQVVRTLDAMTAPEPRARHLLSDIPPGGVAAWQVRSKSEHCVNSVFHCVREECRYLDGITERWESNGLPLLRNLDLQAPALEPLRDAGRRARICPYEITRAALAYREVWIADYNYVFSPRHRGLFENQPGFDPPRSLLIVDEAHNLPARAADARTYSFSSSSAEIIGTELRRCRAPAPMIAAWEAWAHFLRHLPSIDALSLTDEDDARNLLADAARQIRGTPLNYAGLEPAVAEALWELPPAVEDMEDSDLPRLWWSPRAGELRITCLDAAAAIGPILREFGAVVLASATLTIGDMFAASCGLEAPPPISTSTAENPGRLGALNKRETRKLYRQLTSAAELLRVEEEAAAALPVIVRAATPWRDGAYDVAIDTRVDTTFQHRSRYFGLTADTVVALQAAARGPVAAYFPSYAYAQAVERELASSGLGAPVSLQPRQSDLAAQTAWVETALAGGGVLLLVLGSGFSEGIDQLGGRVTHAMVVGPALPEVNAVQRARMRNFAALGRDPAFRRVYQIPGMTKVNQALGRLVRAPGHKAKVLLHCRRFAELGYASLLAPEYRDGTPIRNGADLDVWLDSRKS